MPVQVINGVGIAGIGTGSSSQSGGNTPSFDTDAQAFITAASITATTQQNAVNDLVLDLKAANLWTKMKALYPMVGGTSSSHKWNLKDPRDLDAAYRLNFQGGWTHTSSGATPNGTNGYADTFLNLATDFTLYSAHYSFYFRPSTGTYSFMGVTQGSPYTVEGWMLANNGTNYGGFYNQDDACIKVTDNSPGGHYVSSVVSSSLTFLTKKNIILGSTVAASSPANTTVYLGAIHQASTNTPVNFSNGQISFASLGDGLTYFESALFNQIVEKFQYALGRNVDTNRTFYFDRNYANESNVFIYNAGLTNSTQINATLNLVSDLKYAGIWSKLKAVYPMVGGTATSHKFNLVNAIDTDSSNRLVFQGGWTHDSNGATPNGSNAYANTNLNSSTQLTLNDTHLSFYSRSNVPGGIHVEIGNYNGASVINLRPTMAFAIGGPSSTSYNATTNSTGLWLTSRTSNTTLKGYRNGILDATSNSLMSTTYANLNLFIAARNESGTPQYFSTKQCAFASIGNGLTDIESNLFYQIVEKFQSALGRNINATQPFYYSSGYTNETNVFVFNGGITDATQISATNTLVSTLKTAGIWTKMKAIYPMVGGTATSHKFNLVNPVDSTSAYALTFAGGWTHSSTGALPNGSNTFANTSLNPSVNLVGQQNNMHLSYYSRTNVGGNMDIAMTTWTSPYTYLYIKTTVDKIHSRFNTGNAEVSTSNTNSLGLFILNRTLSTSLTFFRNGNPTVLSQNSTGISNGNILLGGNTAISDYGNKQCAFASIGDGLTDAEALTFYNAVQAFQTTLGRQV